MNNISNSQKKYLAFKKHFLEQIKTALIVLCMSASTTVLGQNTGPTVEIQHFNESAVTNGRQINFEVNEFNLKSPLTSIDTKFGKLIFGVDYTNTEIRFTDIVPEKSLHAIELPITYVRERGNWNFVSQISPSLNSDFEEIGSDDFSVNGKFLARYNSHRNNSWIFGLAADRTFGKSQIYPIVGFHLTSPRNWDIRASLPNPEIRYAIRRDIYLSLYGKPHGGKWDIDLPNAPQRNNWDTSITGYQFGFKTEMQFSSNIWSTFTIGRELNRSGDFTDENGMEYEFDFEDTYFVGLSFGLRR